MTIVQMCTIAKAQKCTGAHEGYRYHREQGRGRKTTLAKHLATAGAMAGLNTLILDMDSQQNATAWGKRRVSHQCLAMPIVKFVTEQEVFEELEIARLAGCDLAIIDTPPGRSAEAPAAVEASDFVLIPFWLDGDAFDGLVRSDALSRRSGRRTAAVLNFATPNSRRHEEAAQRALKSISAPMAPVALHRYEIYRLASPLGLTVQELDAESRAAREVNALRDWVCAQVQLRTNEHVHMEAI